VINKEVAHFLDGRVIKGTTANFFPDRETFHIIKEDGSISEVRLAQLKAVFFVKDRDGDPGYAEKTGFDGSKGVGRKIRCEFPDGEVLTGYTPGYHQSRPAFFITPTDPQSNNERIFVVTASAKRITVLP
jgi:hypothetical protein